MGRDGAETRGMGALTGIGFVVFFLAASVVGFGLVAVGWRTRQLPELLIASGVLGIGTFGFAFTVFALLVQSAHPDWSRLLWAIAFLAMSVGGVTTYVFTWVVFRRRSRLALALVVTTSAIFALGWIAELFTTGFVFDPDYSDNAAMQVTSWALIGALGWAAIESLHYWRLMRRRAALGMGDPVVSNRFLLWGLGIGAAGWGSLVAIMVPLVANVTATDPNLQLSSSLHGLVAAVAMWLAFLPPQRYLRWVGARPAQTAPAA